MQNKSKTWKLISGGNGIGRNVYVKKTQEKVWETIQREHTGNYYLTSVVRAIHALSSVAVGRRFQTEKLTFDGAAILYQLDNDGNVLIYRLEIDSDYKFHKGPQTTGLYQVQRQANRWQTDNKRRTEIQLDHRWDGAHYAAVSGKFDDKEQAGRMLIEHISKAYSSLCNEFVNCSGNHYSLYWQNGGFKSDKHRDHLASLIQQAMLAGARVHWLAHGEGAGTFVRALQVLEKQLSPEHPPMQSPAREGAKKAEHQKALRQYLNRQKVYFSNPRGVGTRKKELEDLCNKVGISYVGTKVNPYDMLNKDARRDALLQHGTVATALAAGHTFSEVLGLEEIPQTIVNTASQVLSSGSVFGAAAVGAYGCFLVRDKLAKINAYVRNLPSAAIRTAQSTFGKGNQRWAA
ncbi:hypothetical protein SAMN05660479_02505 [Microbulbifer thermotolerans]|uniref:hypothetical protein n=1 Tax=Microbulbifer thermotolerans TaxID=252514 RepID=UPI0008ECEC01|nr:hypothetical protein [Microbulbifer thermotolerans]SFC84138.1 hypothetical protein SAMN05660479_02505 [Microbulbifer thermotolerans]